RKQTTQARPKAPYGLAASRRRALVPIEKIQQDRGHYPYADHQRLLVNVELSRVPYRHKSARLVADAQKEKETGNHSLVVREILRGHQRLGTDEVLFSDDALDAGNGFLNKCGVVESDRIGVVERQVERRPVARGHAGKRLAHQLLDPTPHVLVQRPKSTFDLNLIGDDVVTIAALYRAERQQHWLYRVYSPASYCLKRRHTFRRDHYRIDAELRLCAV